MPEPAAWRYQKITKPMFDLAGRDLVLAGRVITAWATRSSRTGSSRSRAARSRASARRARSARPRRDGHATPAARPSCPASSTAHAHLTWDGIHDLARQSMDDPRRNPRLQGRRQHAEDPARRRHHGARPRLPRLEPLLQAGGRAGHLPRPAAPGLRRTPSSRPAATPTGSAARPAAPTRCAAPCASRSRAAPTSSRSWPATTRSSSPTRSCTAVIDEAHRNRLPITAHATYDACIQRVAEFGVDCVEHGGSMTDETIALLLEKKIPIVTTFAPLVHAEPARDRARASAFPSGRSRSGRRRSPTRRATPGWCARRKAGVPIVFGTDAGSPAVEHDVDRARARRSWSKVGVCQDNLDALASITIRAAQLSQDGHGHRHARGRQGGRPDRRRRQPRPGSLRAGTRAR